MVSVHESTVRREVVMSFRGGGRKPKHGCEEEFPLAGGLGKDHPTAKDGRADFERLGSLLR